MLKNDSEIINTGVFTAKTVLKGVTSFLGINLSVDSDDVSKIYKSVNLKDKLIILEDIERSQIDIIEILGFVNNLVEQDGVKVLLVVNEKELLIEGNLKYDEALSKSKLTKKNHYLRVKEKTISDTIYFHADCFKAIESIIRKFDSRYLNTFCSEQSLQDIVSIMAQYNCFNFRSFIYACQKTVDIIEKIPEKYLKDNEFLRTMFFGIILYVFKIKSGIELKWGNEKYYSIDLGFEKAPLFKFCYDYINYLAFDLNELEDTYTSFKEKNTFDFNKSINDKDINIICNYYSYPEQEIITAVKNITKRLEICEDISINMYGILAVNLIVVKYLLEIDIDKAKKLLVDNLRGKGVEVNIEQVFGMRMNDDEKKEVKEEYIQLRHEMERSLNEGIINIPQFDYSPEQVSIFCKYVDNSTEFFKNRKSFTKGLDIVKFAKMYSECSIPNKNNIRIVFRTIYHSLYSYDIFGNDLDSITELKELISNYAEQYEKQSNYDKVERLQYHYFIGVLTDIIQRVQ